MTPALAPVEAAVGAVRAHRAQSQGIREGARAAAEIRGCSGHDAFRNGVLNVKCRFLCMSGQQDCPGAGGKGGGSVLVESLVPNRIAIAEALEGPDSAEPRPEPTKSASEPQVLPLRSPN